MYNKTQIQFFCMCVRNNFLIKPNGCCFKKIKSGFITVMDPLNAVKGSVYATVRLVLMEARSV